MNTLYEFYWYPVYAFVRRCDCAPSDAEALTETFFAYFLERNAFNRGGRALGTFHAFLLESLKAFLSQGRERLATQKPSKGGPYILVDRASAEELFQQEHVADGATPEQLFERRWAIQIIDVALEQLHYEARQYCRSYELEVLIPFLESADEADYEQITAKLKISRANAQVKVSRLRERFRVIVRTLLANIDRPEPPFGPPTQPGGGPPIGPSSAAQRAAIPIQDEIVYLKGIIVG